MAISQRYSHGRPLLVESLLCMHRILLLRAIAVASPRLGPIGSYCASERGALSDRWTMSAAPAELGSEWIPSAINGADSGGFRTARQLVRQSERFSAGELEAEAWGSSLT